MAAKIKKSFNFWMMDRLFFLKIHLPDNVSLEKVFRKSRRNFTTLGHDEIDMIYIGHFDIFDDEKL